MTAVPANLLAPRAPQVNLIPPEVASRRAAGKTRGMIVLVLVGFVLILGAASYATDTQKRSAESALADAQGQAAKLQTEIDKYAAVPLVQTELANATSARLFAGATEVRWEDLLLRLRRVMPAGVDIATMSFANTSVAGVNAPVADPFTTAGVGLVSFNGTSLQYPDVASLERAIDSVRGLTDTQIPTVTRVVTEGTVRYTFSGSATVTAQALDLRFTDAWFVNRNREVADDYLDAYVGFTAFWVATGEADVTAGVPGAAAELARARADHDAALDARETFTAMTEALSTAEEDLATATSAQADGEKGADLSAATAQAKIDALGAGLDEYAASVLALRDASDAVDVATYRVGAAGVLVTAKEAKLAGARTALAGATTNRAALQADVDYYTELVSEAKAVLAKESDSLATATAAALSARDALAPATSTAKTVIETAAVTVATKPIHTPTPSPSASPTAPAPDVSSSPSTTEGGGN